MTPEAIRQLRERLGMSEAQFAEALGVKPRAVRTWQQGTRRPSNASLLLMLGLKRPAEPRLGKAWRKKLT